MPKKQVTEAQLKAALPGAQISVGSGLLFSVNTAGTRHFIGRTRHEGKQVSVYIAAFGRGDGKLSLGAARDRWGEIRSQAKRLGCNPKDVAKGDPAEVAKDSGKTLGDLAVCYIDLIENQLKESSVVDYKNKIFNEILPVLGETTLISKLEWSQGGREKLLAMKSGIESRGAKEQAHRVFMVARQMFDLAHDYHWLVGENPAMNSRFTNTRVKAIKHQPSITFQELPKFFTSLEEASINRLSRISVKMTILTFVRVSALVQMQWNQIDFDSRLWVIPGDTKGLKRTKAQEDIPHIVPLTDEIINLIEQLRECNGQREYCFWTPGKTATPYMNPSNINKAVQRMGYAKLCTAHGLRSLATTAGLEELNARYEIIEKCLGHITGNKSKVRIAYDRAEYLNERREFMIKWSQAVVKQGMILRSDY